VQYIQTKNNFSKFASNNLNLLAYRIVDHTKSTGENYITSTRTQYWKMFAAACGGGMIVSILVMLKFKIGTLHLPVFWESILYSLNYAIGFVAIQLSGFTLATKQPAMTASAIANELKGKSNKDFIQMSIIISRVARTQFISIVGNVLTVMPFILIWMFLYEKVSGVSFLSMTAAEKQLQSNHPLVSLSIMYASIAGVFLFISGIMSGYVENQIVYAKIPDRLSQKTGLKTVLPQSIFNWLIRLLKNKSGAIIGNVTLGFLLGMSTFFGKIFGLPIDIRHVTFAAGNVAMGVFGGGVHNFNFLLACFGGIIIIGLCNVFVSFSFAFYVALKARNLHLKDFPELGLTLIKHFFTAPLEFFLPPKRGISKFRQQTETDMYMNDLGIK
jgi:site-specific recombinase